MVLSFSALRCIVMVLRLNLWKPKIGKNAKNDDFRDSLWRFTMGFGREMC